MKNLDDRDGHLWVQCLCSNFFFPVNFVFPFFPPLHDSFTQSRKKAAGRYNVVIEKVFMLVYY